MDQTRDLSGRELYRIAQLYDPPEFVKKADTEELCGSTELHPDVFGDPLNMQFPCHTPAATWTSTAFFTEKQSSFNPQDAAYIQSRLNYYAQYHGIVGTINSLYQKIASIGTSSEPVLDEDDYALVIGNDKYYPLTNGTEVVKAAEYLLQHRDVLPYKYRREFADKVMQKAAHLGAAIKPDTQQFLERVAGYGACSVKVAAEFLRDRVRASRKGPGSLNDSQDGLLKLAETLEQTPEALRAPGMMVKLAETVDCFDREHKLQYDYGKDLQRVEDVLFELTQDKVASAIRDHCETTTGNIYKLADMKNLTPTVIEQYMGEDFAQTVRRGKQVDTEKMAAVVPTLDRELATLFDRMMTQVGCAPLAKQASSAVGAARWWMLEMAQDYKKNRGRF